MARGRSAKEHIEAIRTCWSLPHVCCIAPRRDHQRPIVATCMLKAHRETRATYSCHISISPPPLLPLSVNDATGRAPQNCFNLIMSRHVASIVRKGLGDIPANIAYICHFELSGRGLAGSSSMRT